MVRFHKNRRSIELMPARYMAIYLFTSVFIFLFGFVDIELRNAPLFVTFILISNLFAYLGFRFGVSRVRMLPNKRSRYINIDKILSIWFWIALVIAIPKYVMYAGDYKLNIWGRLTGLLSGQISFLESYNTRLSLAPVTGVWKIINLIVVVLSPLHWAYMPLSIYYWKNLTKFKKISSAFMIFLNSFMYISTGSSVGFVHFFIFFFGSSIAKAIMAPESRKRKKKKSRGGSFRRQWVIYIIIGIFVIAGFGYVMNDRSGGVEKTSITVGNEMIRINENSLLWRITPTAFRSTLVSIYAYLFKPYVAVDMGLSIMHEVDIPVCFGAGGSWFLADNLGDLLNIDIIQRTYNMRLEEIFGYNHYTQWHTVYVWLANDFTFYLVPAVLFILMTIWGAAWRDFLNYGNVFALLLMFLFVEFVFFMPMNNQVFQHADTLFAFWGLLILWLTTRTKYCWRRN